MRKALSAFLATIGAIVAGLALIFLARADWIAFHEMVNKIIESSDMYAKGGRNDLGFDLVWFAILLIFNAAILFGLALWVWGEDKPE